jgi:hypothetical protein
MRFENRKRNKSYIFLIGAISTFIFLTPTQENAISATDPESPTIVPTPYCACSIRSHEAKSEALFFFVPDFCMVLLFIQEAMDFPPLPSKILESVRILEFEEEKILPHSLGDSL